MESVLPTQKQTKKVEQIHELYLAEKTIRIKLEFYLGSYNYYLSTGKSKSDTELLKHYIRKGEILNIDG